MIIVCALYKFVDLPDCEALKPALLDFCVQHGVKGTLILAQEGINGTIAGSRAGVDAVLSYLNADKRFSPISFKEAETDEMPFYRMKVPVKAEIVTLKQGTEFNPNKQVGQYVKPQDWNALISQPDVVLVDTRNDFEVGIGTFKGAINPKTTKFSELPEWVAQNLDPNQHKKVAMFCTGGIRCEKSTSYLKHLGFEEVYHLEGGILKYLEEVPKAETLWEGECFVFDQRVTVNHDLEKGDWELCHACWQPVNDEMKASPLFEHGVSCPRCYDKTDEERKNRFRERQKQIRIANERGKSHMGQIIAEERSEKHLQQQDLIEKSKMGETLFSTDTKQNT
jgi:UPF0176 protein